MGYPDRYQIVDLQDQPPLLWLAQADGERQSYWIDEEAIAGLRQALARRPFGDDGGPYSYWLHHLEYTESSRWLFWRGAPRDFQIVIRIKRGKSRLQHKLPCSQQTYQKLARLFPGQL